MSERRIDQEIIRATNELKADVALTHRIVTGDENTVIEVSPGNRVRSPKKMVEDTYQETKTEIEERLGSLEDAVNEATEQAARSEQSRQASDSSADSAGASEQEAAASEASAKASKEAAESSAAKAASSESAAKASETAAADSASDASESETQALASKNAAASSAAAAADSEREAQASEAAASDSASEAAESESRAKTSETAAKGSETEAASSEANAKSSETSSKTSETRSEDYAQAASDSRAAALASEQKADEHRQSAAASDESAQSANQSAQSAKTQAVEAKDEAIVARDLARRWATEEEETPIEGDEFSALHWAKVAEQYAGTLTTGMYFAGGWDLGDGFPPEPATSQVPWYRITNNEPTAQDRRRLKKIAGFDFNGWRGLVRKSHNGDQLIWDPNDREWFLIDVSGEVWQVNGKKGDVVLTAEDVGALSDSGGNLSGDLRIPDKGKGIYLTDKVVIRSGGSPDGLLLFGGSEATEARFLMERLTVTDRFDRRGHSVYHEGNIPSASTSTAGITKLNDSLTSTSKSEAATANAVKQVNDKVEQSSGTPVGACMMWPGESAPSGWVEARGQSTSNMSQAIKNLYGANLPDMRGEFPRGWDNGRDIDSSREILSSQGDAFKSHDHTASFKGDAVSGHTHSKGSMNITGEFDLRGFNNSGASTSASTASGAFSKIDAGNTRYYEQNSSNDPSSSFEFDASESWTGSTSSAGGHTPSGSVTVNSRGGSETRPRNIAWMFIIYTGD